MPDTVVAATDETLAAMPAEIVPADTGSDHDPSVFAVACDAVIVPALDVAVCPAKVAVASASTENAPTELIAANPISGKLSDDVTTPSAVVAEAPAKVTGIPLEDVTTPAETVADDAAIATDND